MAYTNHRFCWNGIISDDVAAATPFYETVLGWSAQTVPMGDGTATVFAASDEVGRAHIRPPQMDGEPSAWNSYLRVDDVDAAAKAAAAHGGAVLVPPTDIPPGRFSTVKSPSGAVFTLFHEADPSATDAPDGDGALHWVELHSTDLDADLAWLSAAFGFTTDTMPMGDGDYVILQSGETQVGGAIPQMHPGAPSMWLPWIRVPDVDAAAARATASGGAVVAPSWDVPGIGRLAIVADPAKAVVGVITPPQG